MRTEVYAMPTFEPSQDRLNETSDDEPADPEIAWSLRWLALLALSTIFFKIVGSSEIALAFHWARPLLPLVYLWPGQIILVALSGTQLGMKRSRPRTWLSSRLWRWYLSRGHSWR